MRLFLTTLALFTAALGLPAAARAEWVWPLHGEVITTYRNGDDPYAGGQHRGIDIAGPVGARVVASSGGEVRFAGTAGFSGLTVSVRTGDGRFDTSYLHLSTLVVRAGQHVAAGDTLGAVGTTGSRSASEPHLHFGVRDADTRHAYHNPLDFLPPRAAPPAPEPPQQTPAPVPTPAAPNPARVPDRAPTRVPAGERVPRGAPAAERAPRRVPVGEPTPRRVPRPAPRSAPGRAPSPVPVGQRAPGRVPAGDFAPGGAPEQAPSADPVPRGLPLDARMPRRLPTPLGAAPDGASERGGAADLAGLAGGDGQPASSAPGPSRQNAGGAAPTGPDVGWVLACVGLLAAAAMLGLTEDGRNATRKGHGHLVRLLRPLRERG